MMALSPKAWGRNILWPHAKLLPASISFVESAEGQCLLTVWRVGKIDGSQSRSGHRWMTNGIAISIADGAAEMLIFLLQFLLRVGAADDGLFVVFNFDDGGVWLLV